jgi:tRNA(Ile2) C34 agmatinyltransferase TiaS
MIDVNLQLSHEIADKILVSVLKENYYIVLDNVRDLKNKVKKKDCPFHVVEDYEYDRKLLKALRRVLRYHMTHEEYQAFIGENE